MNSTVKNGLKQRIVRLDGHIRKLRGLVMGAHEIYAILRPMMAHKNLLARISFQKRNGGFLTIRHALYWYLILELVKIVADDDKRVPSILLLREILTDKQVKAYLCNEYSRRTLPTKGFEQVGAAEFWGRFKDQNKNKLKSEFESIYCRAMTESEKLLKSDAIANLRTVRDKRLAHNEMKCQNGNYEFIDICILGKYGDEKIVLQAATRIIGDILALRGVSFDWEEFDRATIHDASMFWGLV